MSKRLTADLREGFDESHLRNIRRFYQSFPIRDAYNGLSISDYKKHLCLKGGALLYAFEGEVSRPTMNLDLLGMRISNEQQKLKSVFN